MKAYSQNILITQVSQAWWISVGIEGEVLIWITALLCQNSGYSLYSSCLPKHRVQSRPRFLFMMQNVLSWWKMKWSWSDTLKKKKQKKKQVLPEQQAITKEKLNKNELTRVKWAHENYLHFNLMCFQLLFVSELVCHFLK